MAGEAPKPTIQVRLYGGEALPENISIQILSDLTKAVQSLAQSKLHLMKVKRSSAAYAFAPSNFQEAIESLKLSEAAIEEPVKHLRSQMFPAFNALTEIANNLKCNIELQSLVDEVKWKWKVAIARWDSIRTKSIMQDEGSIAHIDRAAWKEPPPRKRPIRGSVSNVLLCGFPMMERFETMPDGWRIDKSWGSPECGWQPIHNCRSLLNGGRKGLLRVEQVEQIQKESKSIVMPQKEAVPELSKDEVKAIAETTNQLARAKFKEKLLQELLFDLQVCMIEGWCCKEYVTELKELIDETYRKVASVNQSLTVGEFSKSA